MKVLIVCSINSGKIAPFIQEQVISLTKEGCVIEYYTISGNGFLGYIQNRKKLITKINAFKPDIIHAHYGLSGLLVSLQCKVPVVTTYHGSDINNKKIRRFSKLSMYFSKYNIFVSQKTLDIAKPGKNYALIPCGIETELFKPMDKTECRAKLGLKNDEKLVLFSGSFDNQVKNPVLAKAVVALLPDVRLVELKGYTREQVNELINACDAVLMTSFTEGSPQIIKEAMACNCPIVSVNVGDVNEIIGDTENCFICSYSEKEIAEALQKVFDGNKRTLGREKISRLDNKLIAKQIIEVYKNLLRA